MRIGVYGGSFNPPHIGHLKTAQLAAVRANLDQVYFVPAREPYMKAGAEMASFEQRFSMTALALGGISSDNTKYLVSDIEGKREGPSIMADTMEDFLAETIRPNKDELFLILGYDSYESLSSWRKLDKLLDLCKLIVVDRAGPCSFAIDNRIRKHVAVFTEDVGPISSTFIRNELKKENPSCLEYIPEFTREYIFENHLYGT